MKPTRARAVPNCEPLAKYKTKTGGSKNVDQSKSIRKQLKPSTRQRKGSDPRLIFKLFNTIGTYRQMAGKADNFPHSLKIRE